MRNRVLIIIGLLALSVGAAAQSIPVTETPGKVSAYECSFSEYPADTTASALVLWEKCDAEIDYDPRYHEFRYMKRYVVRYKILKKDGLDRANGAVYAYHDNDYRETVERLNVVTYNLVKGKVVATKAPKSNIIKSDQSERVEKIAYTADAVTVGSVVEVSYNFSSPDFTTVPDYFLQGTLPVNLSVYSISLPVWLPSTRTVRGMHRLDFSSTYMNGRPVALNGISLDNSHTKETFRGVDLPALKNEPMLYCPRDYMDGVSYEVTAIAIPGHFKDFSSTWGSVAKMVAESEIWSQTNARSPFKDQVAAIVAKDEDDLSTITEIVKLVKDNVKWNERINLVPSSLSSVNKARSGSSADINAMIGSALKSAGFKVNPVLVRLRKSGAVLENNPKISAFDTFVLHIYPSSGTGYFLDGADPSCYLNVLPEQYLVKNAFEITNASGGFIWQNLTSLTSNVTAYIVGASISDGTMTGKMDGMYSNGSSYDFKDTFRGYSDEEELYEEIEKFIPARLSELSVTGFDEFSSGSSLSMHFEKDCETAGDLLMVNPFLMPLLSDAAFRHETRVYPVDFSYPEVTTYVLRLEIPEGYVVDQLPKNSLYRSTLPSSMTFKTTVDGSVITVQFKFDNRALIAMPDTYPDVRKYWTDVCAIFNERIILKKAE